ncbi:MAG TPA: RagB/SusD family nutrient uptake outer membrane protein [Bacteroidetes bacterium]|nr:RagB/SusD family nutrient uptake outer membrane protein [Bacteroidota bacterium]
MKKILYIISITLIILLTACNDAFMDRSPKTAIGIENFFKSEEDLRMYTYSLYDFPGPPIMVWDGEGTDDMANTSNYELRNIMLSSDPSSSTVSGGWNWSQLRKINIFLDNFRKADLPEEILAHYEGVARFFRAKFYMEKVKRFSDVPWYDTEIGTGDDNLLYKGRDPRDMVVQKIFEDYEYAAKNVWEDEPSGAVDKWVVLAYEARHALHEGTFRKYHPELNLQSTATTYLQIARDAAKEIMDNGGFAIYNTGNPESDYRELFTSFDLTGNSEVILPTVSEYNVSNHTGIIYYWQQLFGDYDVSPTKGLMQDYLMADGTPYTQQPGYETKLFVEEFVDRDPRLKQTFAYPGWSNYQTAPDPYVQSLMQNFTGYHCIKNWIDSGDPEVYQNVDYPVLRLAEVLLIYAEARAELGELTQEDLDLTINQLRDRAGMPHLNMGVAVDPVQQARYPDVTSGELLEIRRERRIELFAEGFRFDDLMRWKKGKLIEEEPKGIYFPGLGKYDLTGDSIPDIILIDISEDIPAPADKETNALGVPLIYYRAGPVGSDASIWLSNGTEGYIVSDVERGTFVEPKYYYRPIPEHDVLINPNLTQIFDWR